MSTIELPEDVAAALAAAAAERGVSVDELAAETISARFGPIRRRLSFAAVGSSTTGRTAAEAEQLLEEGGFGVDSADR
jgi:ribosomal protein L22